MARMVGCKKQKVMHKKKYTNSSTFRKPTERIKNSYQQVLLDNKALVQSMYHIHEHLLKGSHPDYSQGCWVIITIKYNIKINKKIRV